MRPTIVELTDSFAGALTVVPPIQPGVCDLCHGPIEEARARCWSCAQTSSVVSHPVDLVVPISLCARGGQLHHTLRSYKDASRPQIRHQFTRLLGALLGRFLDIHSACIAEASGRRWDYITTVPSTKPRPGRRPLEDAIVMVKELASMHQRALERGPTVVERLRPAEDNFRAVGDLTGDAVLLLDDTFTSGTRVQAAASTLQAAGAAVTGAVVVGRFINPNYNAAATELWKRVNDVPFDFEWCCIHDTRGYR